MAITKRSTRAKTARRRNLSRLSTSNRRANAAPAQKEERKKKDRLSKRKSRAEETPTHRKERQKKDRLCKKKFLSNERPAHREERLRKDREYRARRVAAVAIAAAFLQITEEEIFDAGGQKFGRGVISLDDRLNPDNFLKIYKQFYDRGYQYRHKTKRIRGGNDDDDDDDDDVTETSSRESKLSINGSTVFGGGRKICFLNPETGTHSPCLRQNIASRAGGKGKNLFNHPLVRKLALFMDALVYKYNPESKDELDCAKLIIPEKYRIRGTCFTAFTLVGVGDSSSGFVHIHKDNRDVVSIILSLGNNVKGGDTIYYKDKSGQHEIARTIFKHGQFQTGPFHDVYHGGQAWTGQRGIFSFYLNKQILNHCKAYRHKAWFDTTMV